MAAVVTAVVVERWVTDNLAAAVVKGDRLQVAALPAEMVLLVAVAVTAALVVVVQVVMFTASINPAALLL